MGSSSSRSNAAWIRRFPLCDDFGHSMDVRADSNDRRVASLGRGLTPLEKGGGVQTSKTRFATAGLAVVVIALIQVWIAGDGRVAGKHDMELVGYNDLQGRSA